MVKDRSIDPVDLETDNPNVEIILVSVEVIDRKSINHTIIEI